LVSIAFPIRELWTPVPILYNDNALHLYYMKLAHAFTDTGASVGPVGYDPSFVAGYPFVIWTWSARLPWLLATQLHGLVNDVILYKVCVFLCGVLGPFCIPVAARRLGANPASMAVAAALAIILWWASWFRWLFIEGMWSFVTVAYFSVPYLVETIRYLEGEGGTRRLIALGFAGAALFFIHPLFPIAIVIGTVLYISLGWPHVNSKRLLPLLLVVPALSLVPNIRWLVGMRQYLESDLLMAYFTTADIRIAWKELSGVYHGNAHGSKAYGPILYLTIAAHLFLQERAERRRIWLFSLLGLVLIGFAAVGGAVPVFRNFQPNRFAPVGYLFLVIPAAFGFDAIRRASRLDSARALKVGARMSIFAVGVIVAYCAYEVLVEVSDVNLGHYGPRPPQVRSLPERVRCITQWLESNTTRQGRVLFEIFPGQGQASDVAYYAYTTKREFIGGPGPWPLRSGRYFAGFVSGRLFGEPIGSIGEERFMKYMEFYNVGWVLAYTAETKDTLKGFAKLAEAKSCENVTTYRVERPLSYFLEGRGVVTVSEFNNVVLDRLEGDRVLLKYNYVDGLKSIPAANIEPVAPMDGMPPFIRIIEPPSTLRLYLGP